MNAEAILLAQFEQFRQGIDGASCRCPYGCNDGADALLIEALF